MNTIKRIVIVGGGAGGLELAAGLGRKLGRKKRAHITLVDASPIHIWKPLLHEVAAGTLNSYEDELNYLAYANQNAFQFCLGSMKGLNRSKKEIMLSPVTDNNEVLIPERVIPYDVLVIAVGSVSNQFNIPGVSEYCMMLDNSSQALQFQQSLLRTLTLLANKDKKPATLSIAVIGGGATGVELCAELHYAIRQLALYGFEFDPETISFHLIEGANRLLPALSEHLSASVLTQLKSLGIQIHLNQQVSEVTKEGIKTKSGEFIPADVKIWAAGIKAPEFLQTLDGLAVNKINQLLVKQTLQTTEDDYIFAIGDCASCPQPGKELPVPPRAQAAHQQASLLIKSIPGFLNDNNKPLPVFIYRDHGSLISLSHYQTIGNLMGRITKKMMIEGWLARLVYLMLYRSHQTALFGAWKVATLMFVNLLTRQIRPRLKLH